MFRHILQHNRLKDLQVICFSFRVRYQTGAEIIILCIDIFFNVDVNVISVYYIIINLLFVAMDCVHWLMFACLNLLSVSTLREL